MENPWRFSSRGLASDLPFRTLTLAPVWRGYLRALGPKDKAEAAAAIQTSPGLRGSPFLLTAVVNAEVLRAQEEWEAVDNIQTEPGNRRNGIPLLMKLPSTCS